jgi:hypothetical protein
MKIRILAVSFILGIVGAAWPATPRINTTRSLSENSVVGPRASSFFRLAKTAKQAMLVLSSMQPDAARRKKGRSKPDRVLRQAPRLPDEVRARQIKDMKFGMFICWSFSTFYAKEWTPTLDKDAAFFRATGCDTDQWCRSAKEAGMAYILFLSKHHDGFCLWDTATTDKKVTNSPLGIDVLAKLRASCDKYGIKLALYFSEGDWNWPGARDGQGASKWGGHNPEVKKAQLQELLTNYGPIEFWWMDHATGTGGLSHEETVQWVYRFQPNSFVGFNHGEPAGRLCLREMGRPGPIGDPKTTVYNKEAEGQYQGYDRIQRFEVQAKRGDTWETVFAGTTCADQKVIEFNSPVKGRLLRLNVIGSSRISPRIIVSDMVTWQSRSSQVFYWLFRGLWRVS